MQVDIQNTSRNLTEMFSHRCGHINMKVNDVYNEFLDRFVKQRFYDLSFRANTEVIVYVILVTIQKHL